MVLQKRTEKGAQSAEIEWEEDVEVTLLRVKVCEMV